jgi:hypothetical protein
MFFYLVLKSKNIYVKAGVSLDEQENWSNIIQHLKKLVMKTETGELCTYIGYPIAVSMSKAQIRHIRLGLHNQIRYSIQGFINYSVVLYLIPGFISRFYSIQSNSTLRMDGLKEPDGLARNPRLQ